MLSRTILYAFLNILVAVLAAAGVELSEDMRALLYRHSEEILLSFMALNGVIVYILRSLTTTPLVGLFFKRSDDSGGSG